MQAAVKATREVSFVKDNASSIDVLLLVAGVAPAGKTPALEYTADFLRQEVEANYIGAALTTLAFIPLLQSSPKKVPAKVLLVSSALGSAGAMEHLGAYMAMASGYSASKAAANMWSVHALLFLYINSALKPPTSPQVP